MDLFTKDFIENGKFFLKAFLLGATTLLGVVLVSVGFTNLLVANFPEEFSFTFITYLGTFFFTFLGAIFCILIGMLMLGDKK